MSALTSGATHHRFKKSGEGINYFKQDPKTGTWLIWNKNRWDRYLVENPKDLVPISTKLKQKQIPQDKKIKPLLKQSSKEQQVPEEPYVSLHPTLMEEAEDHIPAPVLRALISHYKTADSVEVVITVKTTHTIKG